MRRMLAALVMVGVPALAVAQSSVSVPRASTPLPPIGLPLPRIGLPLPSIGLPRAIDATPSRGPSVPLPPAQGHSTRTFIYIVPAYGWNPYTPQQQIREDSGRKRSARLSERKRRSSDEHEAPRDIAPPATVVAPPPAPAAPAPLTTPAAPATPPAPVIVYRIPGCYLGNVPPKDVKLPASCDLSQVITFTP